MKRLNVQGYFFRIACYSKFISDINQSKRFTNGDSDNEVGLNGDVFRVEATLHICNRNQQSAQFLH
jgi:hypothetical protein